MRSLLRVLGSCEGGKLIERWRGRRTRFPNPGCFPTRLEDRNRDFAVLRNPLRRHNWLTSGRAARNPDPSESRRAKRPISAPDADASSRPWSRAARQRAAQTLQIKAETTPPPAKVAPPLSPERAFPIRASAGAKSAGNGKISDFGQDGRVEIGRGGIFREGSREAVKMARRGRYI